MDAAKVEAVAREMFETLHAMNSRPRNWDRHPDGDQAEELGRDTFRAMAEHALAIALLEASVGEGDPATEPVARAENQDGQA